METAAPRRAQVQIRDLWHHKERLACLLVRQIRTIAKATAAFTWNLLENRQSL